MGKTNKKEKETCSTQARYSIQISKSSPDACFSSDPCFSWSLPSNSYLQKKERENSVASSGGTSLFPTQDLSHVWQSILHRFHWKQQEEKGRRGRRGEGWRRDLTCLVRSISSLERGSWRPVDRTAASLPFLSGCTFSCVVRQEEGGDSSEYIWGTLFIVTFMAWRVAPLLGGFLVFSSFVCFNVTVTFSWRHHHHHPPPPTS